MPLNADGAPSGRQVIPGYIRHTVVSIDLSKLNAMVAYAERTVGTLNSISGLRRIRVAAVKGSPPYKSEDRMTVNTAFDSKEAAEPHQSKLRVFGLAWPSSWQKTPNVE